MNFGHSRVLPRQGIVERKYIEKKNSDVHKKRETSKMSKTKEHKRSQISFAFSTKRCFASLITVFCLPPSCPNMHNIMSRIARQRKKKNSVSVKKG